MRYLNFFFIPVVQEYLNEISPTIYGPNKPKTSGKALRILDLQPPASYHDKPATLYILSTLYLISKMSAFSLCEAHHKLSTVKVWILEDLGFDRLYPE